MNWRPSARLCAGIAASNAKDYLGSGGRGHHRRKGVMPSVISGGEYDCTVDRNSGRGVGRGTCALGRSGAPMSNAVAVLLIFATFAVALSTVRRS